VNLPLFHRLKAGKAKPKIAGKESSVAHEGSEKVETTITPACETWQGFCGSASFALSIKGNWQAVAASRQVFERNRDV
jgi:hypothetical protein